MNDRRPIERVCNTIPIRTDRNGRAWIKASDVALLLRAIARGCREHGGNPDCDLLTTAAAIDTEADTIACRAIMQTR
ncbi:MULTISPECIES: hypothetical protein [Streptomyces]|uniref:hypothetical protein n=1 Tax=Streptomyces TaxID=1883 RepID=UPI0002D911BB|nr:hypothetical protein [Streptomyces venezuelae]APE21374.1 hypothetical protein vnz_10305 [Streptomyces venezuelae]QER98764.1 hypothetical protein DEJ43_10440 [Streptomyces venezuelae ATCC 10712]